MQFDSLSFAGFLIVVVALHHVLRGGAARKQMLLIASFIFYAGWNPWFLPLLIVTSSVDLDRATSAGQPR